MLTIADRKCYFSIRIHYINFSYRSEAMLGGSLKMVCGITSFSFVCGVALDDYSICQFNKFLDYICAQMIGIAGFSCREFRRHASLCLSSESLIHSDKIISVDTRTKIYDRTFHD